MEKAQNEWHKLNNLDTIIVDPKKLEAQKGDKEENETNKETEEEKKKWKPLDLWKTWK